MAFDVEAAKADGYTDQEIQAYLASQGTPTPAQAASAAGEPVSQYQPVDRSAEYAGLGQGVGVGTVVGAAVPAAIGFGVAKYGGRAMDAARNMISSTGANAPGGANNPIGGTRIPISTPTTAPAMPLAPQMQPAQPAPQMQAAKSIVQKLALSKLLPAAQMGAGLFYTSPEEIATLKAAEARKRALGQ
jgi:hypothetical protein